MENRVIASSESQQKLDAYMVQLVEESCQQGPINPADFGSDLYTEIICQSQISAENGDFSNALDILQSVDVYEFTAGKREILKNRIEVFEKLNDPNLPFLPNYTDYIKYAYPDWFKDRLAPVIYIWQREFPILEKYQFLKTVFEDRDNTVGYVLVLEAIADMPQLSQKESARTLLRLGSVYWQHDNPKQAEQTFLRILSDYSCELGVWHAAAYYLGNLEEKKGCPEKALVYYNKVIDSVAKDKEVETIGFDDYYYSISGWKHNAALSASYVYQSKMRYFKSLRYTIDAKFKYPYVS